jgi:ribbon-helix-helix CopG family protein
MKKTTVYLPEDLKFALGRLATERGRSEAELIREAIRDLVQDTEPPRPRLPLFSSGDPTLAERVDHFRALSGPGGRPFRILPAAAG